MDHVLLCTTVEGKAHWDSSRVRARTAFVCLLRYMNDENDIVKVYMIIQQIPDIQSKRLECHALASDQSSSEFTPSSKTASSPESVPIVFGSDDVARREGEGVSG
jgi:hypothetical protein